MDEKIISWLLESDVSIQYQVYRDLLNEDKKSIQRKISKEGWGKRLLLCRNENGYWGRGFYQPKWISSHYTILQLKDMSIAKNVKEIRDTIKKIIKENIYPFGGLSPSGNLCSGDICVNGMFLNYASYFETKEENLKYFVDYILSEQMSDGGFNCERNRKNAVHSSLHSTLCVIEGINEYQLNGYSYRLKELLKAEKESREFILAHQLFKSHRIGSTIDEKMLRFVFPSRWKYDILRVLDYFRAAGVRFDPRMKDALDIVLKKRKKDGLWLNSSKYSGLVYFDMEQAGKPGRWNTLRALRVLRHFNIIT